METISQCFRKGRDDGTFPPNKGSRKEQEAHILKYNCTDIIARIQNLEQRLKEIEEKMSDLQATMRKKGDTGDLFELRAKVESFKDEFKTIQALLDDLQLGLAKNDSIEESRVQKLNQLEQLNANLSYRIVILEKELETSKQDNKQLKVRVTKLEEQVRLDDKARALLQVGQVFTEIQNRMYEHVFPDYYNSYTSYTLRQLQDDLKEFPDPEATQRWKDLQKRLKWNYSLGKGMRNICNTRNLDVAHQAVNEDTLQQNVAVLIGTGHIGKSPSLAEANRLIEIWKDLKNHELP